MTPPKPAQQDAWYLRHPPFSRGPLIDLPWQMELDQVTRWLDDLDIGGVIVELGAGSGWWSPLLAGKGELWVYEEDPEALEMARRRLVAHGLMAHLHQRGPAAPAEREADVIFAAFLLGGAHDDGERARRADAVRRWLRPGGTFAFVEAQPRLDAELVDGPSGPLRPPTADEVRELLARAGLDVVELVLTPGAFILCAAVAAPP